MSNTVWSSRRSLAVLVLGLALSSSPAFASPAPGALTSLTVAGLSPAFDPAVTKYTIPKTANCSVPVKATLTNPGHRLYIQSTQTASGVTRNAWICDGKTTIDIVIYQVWTEMGRYTITPVAQPAPPPPPPPLPPPPPPAPVNGNLASLTISGLSPAFSASVKTYSIARTAACSIPVVATLVDPTLRMYISDVETASGAPRNAWVCDGRTTIAIVIYKVWTEVGRYTVNVVGEAPPPPPPSPPPPPPPPAFEPPPVITPYPPPVPGPLPPASPVDAATAVRFLEQTTFGPTAGDIATVQSQGLEYWLARQFVLPETTIADGLNINQLRAQVFFNMANAPDQLRQRVMFALSQTLVVSANKNVNGAEVIPWVRMLSRHAFGNYRSLLREVTVSPSMGKFLDLANSRQAMGGSAPNENFPREVMQLFTIGLWELNQDGTLKTNAQGQPIGAYSQATMKEVARALTGWTYPTAPGGNPSVSNWEYFVGLMEPRPQYHDAGAKTLFGVTLPAGQTVTKDMDDVVDALFQHPNTAPFIATRLIRSLVTSNPGPAYIKRVADVFVNNGQGVRGDLKAVLHAIFTDADAAVAGPQDGRLKDPVLHIIGLGRALGAQIADPNMFMYIFGYLGQMVLTPATVFSFYSPLASLPRRPDLFGPEFQLYAPALAIQRANFIYAILSGQMGSAFRVDLAPFVALSPNPPALVERVNQTLLHGRMSSALRQIILTATQATSDANQRALGALYLAAISSEFAVHAGGPVQ